MFEIASFRIITSKLSSCDNFLFGLQQHIFYCHRMIFIALFLVSDCWCLVTYGVPSVSLQKLTN